MRIPRLNDGRIYWHRLYFSIVPRWMTRYSPPLGSCNYAGYLLKPHEYFIDIYEEIKWFIQRGMRGYSDRDVWGLDYYLTSWMPAALRQLRRTKHGVPIGLSERQWDKKINRIICAFEMARKIQNLDYRIPGDAKWVLKHFRQDMRPFVTHFFDLWD